MMVLDTDTLSLFHRGQEQVVERLASAAATEDIATTVITQAEILRARFDFLLKASDSIQLQRAQQWADASQALLEDLEILRIDADVVSRFDKLKAQKKLRKVGRADLLIASVVLACDATLVTRNLKHFRQVPKLKVVNWAD